MQRSNAKKIWLSASSSRAVVSSSDSPGTDKVPGLTLRGLQPHERNRVRQVVSAALQRALKGLLTPSLLCCSSHWRRCPRDRFWRGGDDHTREPNGHAAAYQRGALAGPRLSFFLPWRRGSARLPATEATGCSNTMRCGPVCVGTGLWHHRSVHTRPLQHVLSAALGACVPRHYRTLCPFSCGLCPCTGRDPNCHPARHSGTALDYGTDATKAPRRAVSALIVV